jgi:hypothetical protein
MKATLLSASIPTAVARPQAGELSFLDSGITYNSGEFTEVFPKDEIHAIRSEPIFEPGKESFRNLYIKNKDLKDIIFTVSAEDLNSVSLKIFSLTNSSASKLQNEPIKFGLLFTRPIQKDTALIPIILIAIYGAFSTFIGTYSGTAPGSSIGLFAFLLDIVLVPVLAGLLLVSIFYLIPRRLFHLFFKRNEQ